MNKQTERLISADKLLHWMETNYDRFESKNDFFEGIRTEILNDSFSPDPIPLPTLKPGDKVRHKSGGSGYGVGTVHKIAKSGERAFVIPWGAYYRLDKLELVEEKADVR